MLRIREAQRRGSLQCHSSILPHASLRWRRRKPTCEAFVDNTAKLRPQASVLALRAAGASRMLKPVSMYMQRTTSGAAGKGLYTTVKFMRCAAGIGLGPMIKYLGSITSAAANNGLSTTINPPLVVSRLFSQTQSLTPGHVPRSVCVWGPSFLAVFKFTLERLIS
jgi:hypothetical protein